MDTLVALCDILECGPNDLIEPVVEARQVRKTAGERTPAPSAGPRARIRRPGADE
jgi:hypothetical protein